MDALEREREHITGPEEGIHLQVAHLVKTIMEGVRKQKKYYYVSIFCIFMSEKLAISVPEPK